MLQDAEAAAMLPANDLDRAREFYADKLKLTPEREIAGAVMFRCGGGSAFFVFQSEGVASGTHTQINFMVADIESEVDDLKARDVVFEEYDTTDYRTVDGVADIGIAKVAWFKDSEENLLSLLEITGQ
jgi:catechol 2,3-dioxygenase-like lactoylglutathione lyase family enzyme